MTYTIHPVILCGGSGTRLWPLSTPERPKQFLALTSDKSMIAETAARFISSEVSSLLFSRVLVVGSTRHASLLATTLPHSKKILEPMSRNSAPAVAAACLAHNAEDLILILPADHDILDIPAFHRAIEIAATAAAGGAIVTFGVEPTHPATGYGYIKSAPGEPDAAHSVEAFVEKPDLRTAESYLTEGSYLWNAGIFLFQAGTMIDALSEHAPGVLASVQRAMGNGIDETIRLDPDAFAETPSISIDYAVMENAENVQTVPVSMGWSDVGGYRALHELLTETPHENYTSGPVVVENADGLYVRSEGPAVSVNGVSNLVIVATPDEVMITPMEGDAAVKTLGAVVQSDRHAMGLSTALRTRAKTWLWTAFETWSKVGWDTEHGGFVEQLNMDGKPDIQATRRVRVQARQVFSFAKAIEMGWHGSGAASTLVAQGIEYIDARLRHPEGGFVHLVHPDGRVADDRRDLYDQAFLILAGSAAYKATGNETALKIANDALEYTDTHLKDPAHGGWFESSRFEIPRRANPHMHMLEAMLEYYTATGSAVALARAAEIVRLFETKFFNPATDVMAEFFSKNWTNTITPEETLFEPGHHYEWATLLYLYEKVSGHDTGSWRRRLIRKADCDGLCENSNFVLNAVRANGTVVVPASRLWHQLERLRSYLYHPQASASGITSELVEQIFEHYLDVGTEGTWLDELDSECNPLSVDVPASMLYHIVSCFEPLVPS